MKLKLFIALAFASIATVSCVSSYNYVDPGAPSSYQYLITSISFEETSYDINVDETISLFDKLVISPSNASVKTVTWSSADTSVVKVDKEGKALGRKTGAAKVSVASQDGSPKTASVTINVK